MAEKVWIRDYAEKHGCKVDWDPVHKTVILDNRLHITPSEISGGKAYVSKRVAEYALSYLGYEPAKEAPPTSGETREQREREKREAEVVNLASRGLPSWTDAKKWLREHLPHLPEIKTPTWDEVKSWIIEHSYKPLHDWVIEHVWNPTVNWVQNTYNAIRNIIPSTHEIYEGVTSFLNKVKVAISNKFLQAINLISDWYGYAVSWVKFNMDKLMFLVSDEIFTAVLSLRFYFKKFMWLVDDAFEQILTIVTRTADVVANYVVETFHKWIDGVGSLLEDYIVEHWDD